MKSKSICAGLSCINDMLKYFIRYLWIQTEIPCLFSIRCEICQSHITSPLIVGYWKSNNRNCEHFHDIIHNMHTKEKKHDQNLPYLPYFSSFQLPVYQISITNRKSTIGQSEQIEPNETYLFFSYSACYLSPHSHTHTQLLMSMSQIPVSNEISFCWFCVYFSLCSCESYSILMLRLFFLSISSYMTRSRKLCRPSWSLSTSQNLSLLFGLFVESKKSHLIWCCSGMASCSMFIRCSPQNDVHRYACLVYVFFISFFSLSLFLLT